MKNLAACASKQRRGRDLTAFKLIGARRTMRPDPDPALPHMLRDGPGLTGACKALADGEATFACITLAELPDGGEVTPIEGLGTVRNPGPPQLARIDELAARCGERISGMVMRAAGRPTRNAGPTEAQVRDERAPNLRRRGTPMRILRRVMRASGQPLRADAKADAR